MITVLLPCLQLKQIALGATLVLCLSIGLAATMVTVAAAAAGMRHAEKRFSGALITIVGPVQATQALDAILK